ncbi:MAG: TauD/TfdA family dioxygenase [Acidimicrobiales bacterium]|nr:TauD/TfdA family dioxygenase [Acidimicrobiales bacterium]
MQVRKIGTNIGARIEGLDFAAGLDDAMIDAIAEALFAHQVVTIEAADMTPEQHLRLARRFGGLEENKTDQFGDHPTVPEITVIDSEEGHTASMWHADETFLENPPLVNLLYGKQIPPTGGDTAFVSTALAYEGLSPKFQELLDGLEAVHDYGSLYELAWQGGHDLGPLVSDALGKGLIHSHPVVKEHSVTGRKWLTVNTVYTRFIRGVGRLKAEMLLDMLLRHMQKPEFAFRHSWREGDLLMWDQQAVQHYAVNDASERRVVHRIAALATADTYVGVGRDAV